MKYKLQIALLKLGGVWILHPKISEFRFYFLKFESIWILYPEISLFGFYHQNFLGVFGFHSLKFGGV